MKSPDLKSCCCQTACPYCGRQPQVIRLKPRQFLAQCQCGAYAAYRTPIGIWPAVMRTRKTALEQWDHMVQRPDLALGKTK